MKSIAIVAAVCGVLGLGLGALGAAIVGLPLAGVAAVAAATGLAMAGSSVVVNAAGFALFNGKGPSAGMVGMAILPIAQLICVPTAGVASGIHTAKRFEPVPATSTLPGRTIPAVALTEDFQGACDGARVRNGQYVLPRGCRVAPPRP